MALTEYYVNSDDIIVFPSTRRNNESRRMSESAIASIINKLVDREEGFIITPRILNKTYPIGGGNLLEVDVEAPFELNIYGYYFKLSNLSTVLGMMKTELAYNKIYANILLESKLDITKKYPYVELAGVDNIQEFEEFSGQYNGLRFTGNSPISSSEYADFTPKSLLVFEKDSSGNWCVPDTSRVKFEWDSLSIKIDGGEVK